MFFEEKLGGREGEAVESWMLYSVPWLYLVSNKAVNIDKQCYLYVG